MSGGVDSAVSALLLREQGYDVTGVNLRLIDSAETCDPSRKACCTPEDARDAQSVGMMLGIPFYMLKMEEAFEREVISPFIDDYRSGRTPNPCVLCNTRIKFGILFERAKKLGFDFIATGHYAKVVHLPDGRLAIGAGRDRKKNQSYYLHGLSQEAIAMTLFPLGDLTKEEVREIARRHSLRVAEKTESQEICFVPQNDYREFLAERGMSFTPGRFLLKDGSVVGSHTGREQFTIGQRRGLGIAHPEPLYVLSIDRDGDILVGEKGETETRSFTVGALNFQGLDPARLASEIEFTCRVQVRYRSAPVRARLLYREAGNGDEARVEVVPLEPLFSVTPGQIAVFYPDGSESDPYILAGGVIASVA